MIMLALALAAPALATTASSPAGAPNAEFGAGDAFYCGARKLGTWFYCDRPKAQPSPSASTAPASSATEQLDAITAELRELKAKAILDPSPDNVTAYIRFQRARSSPMDAASIAARGWARRCSHCGCRHLAGRARCV
jgi:conjugal transfer pilus assembly protein TraF